MSQTGSNIQLAQNLIIRDLEIECQIIHPGSLHELTVWLDEQIRILLEKDFQKLLNLLYRIDVDESKVRKAFADATPSWRLAELIIDRELQKVDSRKKYR